MPVIRFVREGREVECYPGENLREVALRENVELYGLKGKLGNCNGCGQCITCFVGVVAEGAPGALSERTAVEEAKLRRRPQDWRLACQALVFRSVSILTRPQVGLANGESRLEAARMAPLPEGPQAWPVDPEQSVEDPVSGEVAQPESTPPGTTTSDEAP